MATQNTGYEWHPSPCVAQVLREQWPKSGYSERPDSFQGEMRSIQIELIACASETMDDITSARAGRTIAYLLSPDAAVYAQERVSRFAREKRKLVA